MDDLTAPLGLAPSKKPKNGLSRLLMSGGAALVVAAVVVGWAVLIHDPRGSAPMAVWTNLRAASSFRRNGIGRCMRTSQ